MTSTFISRYANWTTLWLVSVLVLKCTWIIGSGLVWLAAKSFFILFSIVGAMFLNTPTVRDIDRH